MNLISYIRKINIKEIYFLLIRKKSFLFMIYCLTEKILLLDFFFSNFTSGYFMKNKYQNLFYLISYNIYLRKEKKIE